MARIRTIPAWVTILLALAFAIQGQEGFAYKRDITNAPEGWAKVELPNEIYARLAPGLSDLRIFGADPSGLQTEIPYVLRQPSPSKRTEISFRLLNESTSGRRYFYTFDTGSTATINRIELSFSRQNFDRRIRLEGSQDLNEWRTVLEDYRILSVRNENADFSFTSLRFPDAAYRYYLLSFESETDPGKLSASIFRLESNAGAVRDFPVASYKSSPDGARGITEIEVRLRNKVPVSSITIAAPEGRNYYRSFELSFRSGTDKTGRELYSRAGEGILSSLDSDPFEFPEVITDALRITVRDGDDMPLEYGPPKVAGRPYEILVRFPSPGDYQLFYSNPEAKKPEYDLAHFADKAPSSIPPVSLGVETTLDGAADTPAYGNWPLWAVMITVALLMLFFAFRLLKKGR